MRYYFLFKPQSVVAMPVKKDAAISPKTKRATWAFSASCARISALGRVAEEVDGAIACLVVLAGTREVDAAFTSPLSGGIFEPYLLAYA